jgi:hypothetical protein
MTRTTLLAAALVLALLGCVAIVLARPVRHPDQAARRPAPSAAPVAVAAAPRPLESLPPIPMADGPGPLTEHIVDLDDYDVPLEITVPTRTGFQRDPFWQYLGTCSDGDDRQDPFDGRRALIHFYVAGKDDGRPGGSKVSSKDYMVDLDYDVYGTGPRNCDADDWEGDGLLRADHTDYGSVRVVQVDPRDGGPKTIAVRVCLSDAKVECSATLIADRATADEVVKICESVRS